MEILTVTSIKDLFLFAVDRVDEKFKYPSVYIRYTDSMQMLT
jgi:hypothetical protein